MFEALEATPRHADEQRARGDTLIWLTEKLPDELMHEALLIARQLTSPDECVRTLAGILPHLPELLRKAALDEAVSIARQLPEVDRSGYSPRVKALARLVPFLAGLTRKRHWSEALNAVRGDQLKEPSHELRCLAPHLSGQTLARAVDLAGRLSSPFERARAIRCLARHLTEPLFEQGLAVIREIQSSISVQPRWRITGMRAGRRRAARGDRRGSGHRDAAARRLPVRTRRRETLREVAACLPGSYLGEALAVVRQVSDEVTRAETLAEMATQLSEPLVSEAADAVAHALDIVTTFRRESSGSAGPALRGTGTPTQGRGDHGPDSEPASHRDRPWARS